MIQEQIRTFEAKTVPINRNKFSLAEQYLANKYEFRLNTVSLVVEYRKKGTEKFEILNENSIFRELQNMDLGLSITNLIALLKSDFVPQYDPFVEYFENLPPWNGKDNISNLASYVKAVDGKEWKEHLKKHLVRSVACALDENYFNKQALIIVHELQNSGKSTFIRFLCPPKLNYYIAEDVTTDKDSRILLVKNFIINLDELDKLSRKEVAAVKSFISKVQINERLPYDRKNSILRRKASFFGSTNNFELLDDPTGSVRWLCFDITGIDFNYSKQIDINQVWAEAHHLYKSGFQFELTKEEIQRNEERNKNFQVLSMERELISKLYEPDEEKNFCNFMTATDVLDKLHGLSNIAGKLNKVQVGKALTVLGFPKGKEMDDRRSGYYLKLKNLDQ
ncbi:virulence-associated E family protein [Draconibacterium sp.]|nr:virulence-associated E family protein [Draconibacterium sp.]